MDCPQDNRTASHKIAQHFILTSLGRSITGEMVVSNCAWGSGQAFISRLPGPAPPALRSRTNPNIGL